MVDELREEAAKIRGLAWKEVVPADLITRKQLREFMMSEIDEEYPPEKRERDLLILRRIGLMNDKEDPVTMELQFLEVGVAGFYDPKKKHMRIIQGFVGDGQRPTILHELTHALEDQYVDLRARVKPLEEDPDRLFAEKCIEEGSAEYARVRYEAAHPELAKAFAAAQNDEKMGAAQLKVVQGIPAFMWQSTLMQYSHGLKFVERSVAGGSYGERIAALYKDPPVSQEQILHPGRWFGTARDYPQAVVWAADLAKTAGEGWTRLHEIPSGELDLAFYLDFHLGGVRGRINPLTGIPPNPGAKRGASGWDAGLSLYLKKEGAPLAVIQAWAFDTEKDAWEAAEMLGKAAKRYAAKDWKGGDWQKDAVVKDGVPAKATLDYANQFGAGRLHLDGTHILGVDGVAPDVLERLWPVVLQTKFVRDARDTWTPGTVDPAWANATFRNEDLGAAVSVPNAGWTAGPALGRPNAFASVAHAEHGVEAILLVIPQAAPVEVLLPALSAQLKPAFPEIATESAGPAKIADAEGVRLVLGKRKEDGKFGELFVATATDRIWIGIVVGPEASSLDKTRADLETILRSVIAKE
jgi:hypothetical protein